MEIFAERSELAAQYPNPGDRSAPADPLPFAEFFFVSPESPKLAKAIQTGLERAYADGSFMAFFRENPKIREALASANLEQRVTIALPNPDMTPCSKAFRPNIGNIHRRRSKRTRYPALRISTADVGHASMNGHGIPALGISAAGSVSRSAAGSRRGHPIRWAQPAADAQEREVARPQYAHQGGAMKRLDDWFRDYGQSHQHPVNVAIHKVAVPGIYLCILALLWCLPAGPLPASLNWAGLAAIPVLVFYLRLSLTIFTGMTAPTALGLAFCHVWQGPLLWPALIGFVLFWIAQFVGHHIEGKRPPFSPTCNFCW